MSTAHVTPAQAGIQLFYRGWMPAGACDLPTRDVAGGDFGSSNCLSSQAHFPTFPERAAGYGSLLSSS